MKVQIKFLKKPIARISDLFKKVYHRIVAFIERFPVITFFVLLFILLALIVTSSVIRTPKPEESKKSEAPKQVSVYRIGSAPRIVLQAQVEKSGVVHITSLMGGVVQKIHKKEGEHVSRGETLVSLSTNYQGGNAFVVQRQIAQKQYENVKETYQTQIDIITKQRDLANAVDTNADELREITGESVDDTQAIINLNNSILSTLGSQLNQLTASNSAGQNTQAILAIQGQQSQLMSGNLQLQNALNNAEYQSSSDNPPAQISNLQKDITLKQLDLQQKALELGKEVSGLQLSLARINEALMYPSAPFSGTIQRVLIKEGQAIQPGMPLLILSQDIEDDPIVAIAYAPREIARSISIIEESTLFFGGTSYRTFPSFVTNDAIQGTLYGIYFPLPDNYNRFVTDKGYIQVEVPVGYYDTSAVIPFIPIDSVYQTQDSSTVFIIKKGRAVAKEIRLGAVVGSFVQVAHGLNSGDEIILDRTVVANEKVEAK